METNPSDKPSTSKAAQRGSTNKSTASPSAMTKTHSSSIALTNMDRKSPSLVLPTNTPTLAQIGKQGSINFRHSYLYDSDADDQTFLLRTPSIRSHKFIIIPATSNLGQDNKKFPTAISTTSLTSLQRLPLRSPTNQNLSELIATPTTPTPSTPSPKTTINRFRTQPQPATTPPLMSRSDVIHHQSNVSEWKRAKPCTTTTTATTALSNVNTSVKFTIEDYESDNATDATTTATRINAPTTMTTASSRLDALYSSNMPAITSIYSANNNSNNNNNNFTLPLQSASTTQLLLSSSSNIPISSLSPATALTKSSQSPSVRPVSALLASSSLTYNNNNNFNSSGGIATSANCTPSLGIGLRPRNDRNSSMRSVVSGE